MAQQPYSWTKHGLIFKPSEHKKRSWMNEFAQGPSTLIFDDFVRIFFSCRPPADDLGQYVSYTGFVDVDRNNLKNIIRVSDQPVLNLGNTGCFDEFGIYPFSVLRMSPTKIRGYYGGWTRCESVPFNVAIGVAESDDQGQTFKRLGEGPVIPYSPDEPFILSGPKIRKFGDTYFLYYIAGSEWITHNDRPEPIYRIRLATSSDGLNWSKINKDLISTRIEANECQASPDVIFANGIYHMFFCYRRSYDYRQKEGGYRIGYASSLNAIDWVRRDDVAGIDISNDGWDSEMVAYPHIFELDGQIHMFYLGNGVGREGFGLATLDGVLDKEHTS